MLSENVFVGAKNAFIFELNFLKSLAKEIGMEKALSINRRSAEEIGKMQGELLKEQINQDQINLFLAYSLLKIVPENIGIDISVEEETDDVMKLRMKSCPIYEAAMMLRLDPKQVCNNSTIRFMKTVAKELEPKLKFKVTQYRTDLEDFCKAEIFLEDQE